MMVMGEKEIEKVCLDGKFRCLYLACRKIDVKFSNLNDLKEHKKNVHKIVNKLEPPSDVNNRLVNKV